MRVEGEPQRSGRGSAEDMGPHGSGKKRKVVVVRDSLLRGMERHVSGPDLLFREMCCLLGARIQDITDRLPKLIKPADKYPFVLIHVGTNDTASNTVARIKEDYEALGRQLKTLGAQVVFSSILPVTGRGARRERTILEVNRWLSWWCW